MITHNKKGFTLVELIVVITILAILGTIAFISLQGYSKDARNGVRVSDVNSLETALELFALETGKYPEPGNAVDITGSGGVVLWKDGIIDDTVMTQLGRVSELPTDPKTGEYIEYSTILSNKKYELKSELEVAQKTVSNSVLAANTESYIQGTYNGLYIVGQDNVYYSAPSLHTSITGSSITGEIEFLMNAKKINYTVSSLTHSGVTIMSDNVEENYTNLALALKSAYENITELQGSGIYAVVSSIDQQGAEELGRNIKNGKAIATDNSGSQEESSENCYDGCLSDSYYVIDSDNILYPDGCASAGLEDPENKCILRMVPENIYVAPGSTDHSQWPTLNVNSSECTSTTETCARIKTDATASTATNYCNTGNWGGKTWYMPPVDINGLESIYNNKDKLLSLSSSTYWSSTFNSWNGVNVNYLIRNPQTGNRSDEWGSNNARVRCVSE